MVAEKFANFIAGTTYEALPDEIVTAAKERILDTIGAAVAGSANWEYKDNFLNACRSFGQGCWNVIGSPTREFPLSRAAMINSTFAHAIELDDGHKNAGVHAGASVVPTALTLGAGFESSGKDVITAVVLGYDIVYRLASSMAPYQIEKGFHPSGNDDTVGAAAVAGKLMRLDEKQTANGLGLSALYSSGLMEATVNGQSSKCIQVGNASYEGIAAATYAKNGMEGTLSAFEGKSGFFRAKSENVDAEKVCEGLGEKFYITDTYSKLYPTARHAQPAIEAVLDLSDEYGFGWDDVERVWVGTHKVAYNMTGVIKSPKDSSEAKFSIPYGVAIALREHAFGVGHLSDKYTQDRTNIHLASLVTVEVDPEVQALYPRRRGAKVEVFLKDGRSLKREVYDLKGSPANPVGWDEIEKKFRANAQSILDGETADNIVHIVARFDQLDNLRGFMEMLA